jgi:hypothetical protein
VRQPRDDESFPVKESAPVQAYFDRRALVVCRHTNAPEPCDESAGICVRLAGKPEQIPVCGKITAMVFKCAPGLLLAGVPPSRGRQRPDSRGIARLRFGAEQQPDLTSVLQFIGEQPKAARVEEGSRYSYLRLFSEPDPHPAQERVDGLRHGLSGSCAVRREGRPEIIIVRHRDH